MSGPPPSAPEGASRSPGRWLRPYWAALLLGVLGLVLTAFLAGQMDRWARARDDERFAAEARQLRGMLEQKMERYESALQVLGEVCARSRGEVSAADWTGWQVHMLDTIVNYANIRCLLVAPRITQPDREGFGQRARAEVGQHPGKILTIRESATEWYPVWRHSTKAGWRPPELGDDLLAKTDFHPSFEPVVSSVSGEVSPRPYRLHSTTNDHTVVGFWFAQPLRKFATWIAWQRRHETQQEAAERRVRVRADQTVGLLAAFISGDLFLDEFNAATNFLHVQLFTALVPNPEELLNPGHPPPPKARFVQDLVMLWYGQRWCARMHSTPVFEAGSLRYRTGLVWGGGALLSMGLAAAVAWQTRGRLREEALAGQLRQALGQQERLSRDLHDVTLQSLYGVGLGLQRAQRLLEKRPADAATQLTAVTLALQRVVGELRAVIRQSDPSAHGEVPLGEALQGVVDHFKTASEMELLLAVEPGADHDLTPGQSLELLNIAREALSNSVRHSGARTVRITLLRHDDRLELSLEDDGCGFDPLSAGSRGRGLGHLATRVGELGGSHRWEAASGQGMRLFVEIPLTTGFPPTAA